MVSQSINNLQRKVKDGRKQGDRPFGDGRQREGKRRERKGK